jgi:general secretion pathway protein E
MVPKAVGCSACGFSGYYGQTGLFEILIPNETFRTVLSRTHTPDELYRAAHDAGMLSLLQDGVMKMLRGITTPEELERVL